MPSALRTTVVGMGITSGDVCLRTQRHPGLHHRAYRAIFYGRTPAGLMKIRLFM